MRERDSEDSFRSSLGFGHGQVAGKRHRTGRSVVVGAYLALLLTTAACSSNDTSTTATSSQLTAGSTPSADTTVSTSDTPPSTPSSTNASATSNPPDAQAELEVRAATELGYELFRKCLEALPSCDASTLTPARTGDLLKQNETTITEWNGLGLVLKNPAGWDLTVETIELNDDLTEARVTVCWNDSRWLVYPASGPDGSDVIYGDGGPSAPTESARETLLLRREGAAWLAYDGTGDGESSTEEDLCAAT